MSKPLTRKQKRSLRNQNRAAQRQQEPMLSASLIRSSHVSPFPQHMRTKMTVGFNTTILEAAQYYAYSSVKFNDCYDPTSGIGARQPYGFDHLCSSTGPYTSFLVLGSKITLTFFINSTDKGLCWVYPTANLPGACPYQDIPSIVEGPGTLSTWVWDAQVRPSILTHQTSVNKLLGIKNVMDEKDLRGAYSASPSKQGYWVFGMCTVGNEFATARVIGSIEYDVMFLDRPVLAAS